MTENELNERLTLIEEQAEARQARVDAYRDQELAKAFVDSEWSQDDLAKLLSTRWGKEVTRRWVGYHLMFGRFLVFFGTSGSERHFALPPDWTEREFRKLWEATDASGDFSGKRAHTKAAKQDEEKRFQQIIKEVTSGTWQRRKKPIRIAIAKAVGSKSTSAWMTATEIRDKVASELPGIVLKEDIEHSLRRWSIDAKAPFRVEQSLVGGKEKYRLIRVKGNQVLPKKKIREWSHDLMPLLADLTRELKKHQAERSDAKLAEIAGRLTKVLEYMNATSEKSEKRSPVEV